MATRGSCPGSQQGSCNPYEGDVGGYVWVIYMGLHEAKGLGVESLGCLGCRG